MSVEVAIVPIKAPDIELASRDKAEAAATTYLIKAKAWLVRAVDATSTVPLSQIKNARAEIYTVKEATKQRGLARDIQEDATEMARRADYALGKAIRDGQARGEIRSSGQSDGNQYTPVGALRDQQSSNLVSVSSLASNAELYGDKRGAEQNGIYAMADNADPAEFEQALAEAKEEGNLSRANVVRKVRGIKTVETRDMRASKAAEMAAEGNSTRQIAKELGIAEATATRIITDYGIDVPADRFVKNRPRIDTNRVIDTTVSTLEGICMSLESINPDDIDQSRAQTWLDSLTESIKALSQTKRQIKESLQ